MSIAIVTDSSSQLSPEEIDELGVHVVPIPIVIDGVELRDGVDIDANAFYERLREAGEGIQLATSQPSPGDFIQTWTEARDAGATQIVSIHVGEDLSGTLNSARLAAADFPLPVHLVDSKTTSYGIGIVVREVVSWLQTSNDIAALDEIVEQLIPQIGMVFVLQDLRYILKGGRMRDAALPEGTKDIPVLGGFGGGYQHLANGRSIGELVGHMAVALLQGDHQRHVAIAHAAPDTLTFTEMLEERVVENPMVESVRRYRMGPAVCGPHRPGHGRGISVARKLIAHTAIGVALLASACASTATVDPAAVAEVEEELVEAFDKWAETADGGGIAFVGQVGGEHVVTASGTDASTGSALSTRDRVRVGSISKVFTATLVMQLVDSGDVVLAESINTYVDGLAIENDVTVEELLSHRSGIPNYTDSAGFDEVVMRNPTRRPSPADLIAFADGSDFAPGERFAYSNTNYIVLGLLIEAVSDRSLADQLESAITGPLGLEQTEFADGTFTDVASGYSMRAASGTSAGQSYESIAYGSWAAGGMVTTVEELAVFLDALLIGDLISVKARAKMLERLDNGEEYGLGLHAGPDFGVGHGGSIIGFNSVAEVDLDTGVMVIVVVNNDSRRPEVASEVLAELIVR